jgi:hypothetical protein
VVLLVVPEMSVRLIVGDKHLICLLKWSVEAILCSDNSLVNFDVMFVFVVIVPVRLLYIHDSYPYVFHIAKAINWEV